jgi:type IV pilus assembly protein PilC
MVFVALLAVMIFLGIAVLPRFEELFTSFHIRLPWPTEALLLLSRVAPAVLALALVIAIGGPILWALLRVRGRDRAAIDLLVLPLPLVGPALRLNLIARWCDAARIGVDAGLDLPAAIDLAGDAVGSPRLRRDGAALIDQLSAGRPLSGTPVRMLPPTVPAAIELASGHHDLPSTLRTLSDLYERQADVRVNAIPAVLTPLLVLFIAASVGLVIVALLMPFASVLNGMGGIIK